MIYLICITIILKTGDIIHHDIPARSQISATDCQQQAGDILVKLLGQRIRERSDVRDIDVVCKRGEAKIVRPSPLIPELPATVIQPSRPFTKSYME